jgi:ribosomal protein S18 acetylase RimI-like enzyme
MPEQQFRVRPAIPEDEARIATLVVEGFVDKFRPVFGKRLDRAAGIMERWVRLEHAAGGVRSLAAECTETGELVGSVGVRAEDGEEDVLARGLWGTLRNQLGTLQAIRASMLLSYPRYSPRSSEAYVERLVVATGHRERGVARALLHEAERLSREAEKKTVGLHVSGNNLPAMKLYEEEGFEEVSRQRSLLTGHFLKIRDWIYLRRPVA